MDWVYLNGILLLFPMLLIRYGVLGLISKEGLTRAYYEPPVKEKYFHAIYNISINFMFISMFFYKIKYTSFIHYMGFVFLLLGFIFYLIATINFAHSHNQINTNGLYKISRNPMYVGFFIYFIGVFLTFQSLVTLIILLIYQYSCHYIIKSL